MIRDITLGQYYGVESPIHRLDPRIKIIATILLQRWAPWWRSAKYLFPLLCAD